MFTFASSIFSIYKENVTFLHSSGEASYLVERVVLGVQELRSEFYAHKSDALVGTVRSADAS